MKKLNKKFFKCDKQIKGENLGSNSKNKICLVLTVRGSTNNRGKVSFYSLSSIIIARNST